MIKIVRIVVNYMLLFQFQFSQVENEKEYEIIPNFCKWLCEQVYARIDTAVNRRKIQLRISYLYTVPWIKWLKPVYIDTEMIMESIHKSLTYKQYRGNVWKIETNTTMLIPNTKTNFDRLIRFINFGDAQITATGIFTLIQEHYTFYELQNLWYIYCLKELGYTSETRIIGEGGRNK